MTKKSKSIVFGGSGFIGSHIADELSAIGHETFIYDIKESNYLQQDQTMIIGDLSDIDALIKATKNMDYVFHFAGIADVGYARAHAKETFINNVLGTLNLLEACKTNNVKRFVFASTIYVYSQLGSFYRASKQSCELLINNFYEEYKLPFTILRFGSLYGPRANKFNFINNAIHDALEKGVIVRKGTGKERRDYIHVQDAAKASVGALEKQFENQCVMIKGTQTMRVSEILLTLQEMLGGQVKIEYTDEDNYDAHYSLTPFSFRPQSAKQVQLDAYYDLGQGLLDCIYEMYESLEDKSRISFEK